MVYSNSEPRNIWTLDTFKTRIKNLITYKHLYRPWLLFYGNSYLSAFQARLRITVLTLIPLLYVLILCVTVLMYLKMLTISFFTVLNMRMNVKSYLITRVIFTRLVLTFFRLEVMM